MKKPILLFILIPFLFSCSLFAPVNDVDVHNDLVAKLDNLKDAEDVFYNSYLVLKPGDDFSSIEEKYLSFDLAVSDLDNFFDSTKFASYQKVFVESYKEFYHDFVFGYLKLSSEFVSELKDQGVIFDVINKYAGDLDRYSIDFVDIHNRLIDIINQQADE